MFHTSLNLQVKDNFNHMQKIRYRIADMYRRHIDALKGRADVMSQVFESEIGYLVKFYSKRKKGSGPNKKHQRMVVKLSNIDKNIKQRVLMLYMARMKFYYTVKTLKWFLLYRSDSYDEVEQVSLSAYKAYANYLLFKRIGQRLDGADREEG